MITAKEIIEGIEGLALSVKPSGIAPLQPSGSVSDLGVPPSVPIKLVTGKPTLMDLKKRGSYIEFRDEGIIVYDSSGTAIGIVSEKEAKELELPNKNWKITVK